MVTLANRVKVETSTVGTGTISLGSAVDTFQTFADGGVTNGQTVRYTIEDDNGGWEIGTGVYSSTGPTLTRVPSESSNGDAAINLSGSARVFVTAAAADIMQPANNLSDVANAATAATNLGLGTGDDVTHASVTVDTLTLTGGTGTQGQLSWNTDEETVDLIQNGATLQLGQEVQWHCRNNTLSTIANGTPVMATGTIGASGRITIAPMVSTTQSNAKYFIGIATEDIAADTDGKVTHFGKVRGIDTSAFTEGAVLYLDPTTDGGLTETEPTSGMNIPAAFVIVSHASVGELAVRVNTIDENHFATAAQGLLADSALQSSDIGVSVQGYNANTVVDASYVHTDNNYTTTEKNKLAGIEAGATADQSAFEIKTAYESNANTNAYTDAEKTKLAGIEANAKDDQTITAGSGLTGGGTGNVTISHADTSTQASVDNSGATVIQDVTLDDFGHVTSLGSKTLTAADVGAATASHTHSISQVTGLQTALDNKLDDTQKGAANGLAELDATGKVPSAQLPSYVDDVLEYAAAANFPATGETGKLYVALDTNDVYRWSGSAYVKVSDAVSSADQASKLATPRTISLSGDVSGSTSFDGSANVSITATVADNSHNHTASNISDFTEAVQDIIGADVVGSGAISVSYNDTTGDTTITHVDTSSQASVDNSGATFIQDVTLDTYGHVTGLGSVTVTPALIGASDTSHNHTLDSLSNVTVTSNAAGEILKWNGSAWINNTLAEAGIQPAGSYLTGNQTITLSGDLTGSGTTSINAQIAANVVGANELNITGNGTTAQFLRSNGDGSFTWATPTDTDTTYSAGSGIGLSGTTFSVAAGGGLTQDASGLSHADTSAQASVNNSGATVIQDVTLDTYGHVTGLASKTLTAADVGAITGNQTITLSGDVSGSGTTSIVVTVADDSHNHVISNVDGLQTALDGKASVSHTHDYVPERNRSDWNDGTVINNVVGQLAWKNYGNNHTIFDASQGTSPNGTAINNTNPQVNWTGSYPTLMGWNGSNTYGVRVDVARYAESAPASAPSSAQVGSATAGLAVGAVGTYAFLMYGADVGLGTTEIPTGSTMSGSSLRYAGELGGASTGAALSTTTNSLSSTSAVTKTAPSGTWRSMGFFYNKRLSSTNYARGMTLWLRIS